jgi:hypothetical protein
VVTRVWVARRGWARVSRAERGSLNSDCGELWAMTCAAIFARATMTFRFDREIHGTSHRWQPMYAKYTARKKQIIEIVVRLYEQNGNISLGLYNICDETCYFVCMHYSTLLCNRDSDMKEMDCVPLSAAHSSSGRVGCTCRQRLGAHSQGSCLAFARTGARARGYENVESETIASARLRQS